MPSDDQDSAAARRPRRKSTFHKIKRSAGDGFDRIEWLDVSGRTRSTRATSSTAVADVDPRHLARRFPKFETQSNYMGRYWFAGIQDFVLHESMTEYATLMLLDHLRGIAAIAAQPLRLTFADGRTHVPDYLAVRENGHRLLIDVHKPGGRSRRADDLAFLATSVVCARIGWDYEVFDAPDEIVRLNLEYIARYQHPRYAPEQALRARLIRLSESRLTFGEIRQRISTTRAGENMPALYHCLWARDIRFDLSKPLTDRTRIWRADKG